VVYFFVSEVCKLKMKFLAVVLVALAVTHVAVGSFVGEWTNDSGRAYGVSLYVCVSGSNFYGYYSETGILRGTIAGSTVTGTWYEGGGHFPSIGQPTWGPFSLTLEEDTDTDPADDTISGTWSYAGEGVSRVWGVETRISTTAPSSSQCWVPSSTVDRDDILGRWSDLGSGYDTRICRDTPEDLFFATYTYGGADLNEGFAQGVIVNGIYMGEWNEHVASLSGTELYDTLDGLDGFRIVWWDYSADHAADINDDTLHSSESYDVYNGKATDKQCLSYFDSSSASLVAPLAVVALGLVGQFF